MKSPELKEAENIKVLRKTVNDYLAQQECVGRKVIIKRIEITKMKMNSRMTEFGDE